MLKILTTAMSVSWLSMVSTLPKIPECHQLSFFCDRLIRLDHKVIFFDDWKVLYMPFRSCSSNIQFPSKYLSWKSVAVEIFCGNELHSSVQSALGDSNMHDVPCHICTTKSLFLRIDYFTQYVYCDSFFSEELEGWPRFSEGGSTGVCA